MFVFPSPAKAAYLAALHHGAVHKHSGHLERLKRENKTYLRMFRRFHRDVYKDELKRIRASIDERAVGEVPVIIYNSLQDVPALPAQVILG